MDAPASGRIRETKLPALLRQLQQEKRTGVLTLCRSDQERSIYLKQGDIIFATSRYEDDRLGEMLLKSGRINLEQYEISVELLKKTGKRQGTILVEQGYIDPKELFNAVLMQVKEIVQSLFTWIDGDYRFIEGPLPTDEVITLKMSTGNLILDGVRRITDWTRLYREIPPLDTILQVGADPRNLFQDIQLTNHEYSLLNQVDGQKSIRDLFKASPLPPLHTIQMIHFFISLGVLEAARSRKSSAKEEGSPHAVMEEKPEAADDSKSRTFDPQPNERQAKRERIEQAFLSTEGQDHYQILGIGREATGDQIKRAYFKLAKEYHPDRHLQEGMGDMHDKLESLFRRVTRAYDTLLTEQARKEYDMSLAIGSFQRGRRQPAGGQSSPHEQALQQYRRAQEAYQRGDYSQVVYCMEWVLQIMPDKSDYHHLLGRALLEVKGRLKEAEDAFKRAIELDPANPRHYVGLGQVYKKGGLKGRALTQFQEALKWNPDDKLAKKEIEQIDSRG